MPRKRQVYLLDPKKLDPETIAVTFAKTSRSPQGFREIAAELTAEKSAQFHEKWVVGYGHASVAEHAVLHIGIENVSRLAVESLQSNRLASYTEKSTRYQKWSMDDFYFPDELEEHKLAEVYKNAIQELFLTYEKVFDSLKTLVEKEDPRQKDESESAWENRIRCTCADACRFLLPACSIANVGMTINARSLEHGLCKMLSHPLREIRSIGNELQALCATAVPTLVKYASAKPYLEKICGELRSAEIGDDISDKSSSDWCTLVSHDSKTEEKILAAVLFKFNPIGFKRAREIVAAMSQEEQRNLAERLFKNIGEHEQPIRELEYGDFTFELILDQGAFYELKRHRMMTLTPQPLGVRLGYATPRAIVDAGMQPEYKIAMKTSTNAFEQLHDFNPEVAAYVVPNGFNRRVLLCLNLRSVMHLVSLRTAPNAHFSLRRIAQRMGEILQEKLPLLGKYIRINESENWHTIQDRYFA